MRTKKLLPTVCAAALMAGCGAGGLTAGGDTGSSGQNASPGGIWSGTESVSGLQITGIVDETGELHFIRSDGVQYVGTATTSGDSVSASVQGLAPLGAAFPDGSTSGSGTISGTIEQRVSMSLSTSFTTSAGTVSTGTLDLTFDQLYNVASSLATIAGNYTDATGTVVSVSSDGSVFAQVATSGCVFNGTISIIDSSYNAYRIQGMYESCTGSSAVLNGVSLSGLATYNNTVTPAQIIAGVNGMGNGTDYAIVYSLNRS